VQADANKIAKTTDTRYGMQVMLPPLVNKFVAKNGRQPNAAELEELQAQAFTISANLNKQYAAQRGVDQLELNKDKEGRERFADFMKNRGGSRALRKIEKEQGREAADKQYRAWEKEYIGGGGSSSPIPKGWSVETQ
jgi:hypothetical protein